MIRVLSSANGVTVYVVRGKRRTRARYAQPHTDAGHSVRSSRPSEAAGSERTELQARGKRHQRRREGTGEGEVMLTNIAEARELDRAEEGNW